MDEARKGVEEDNGEGFSCLQEIELTRFKSERVDGEKLNLAELNRMVGVRNVWALRFLKERGEEEDRSRLSMASICKTTNDNEGKRRTQIRSL